MKSIQTDFSGKRKTDEAVAVEELFRAHYGELCKYACWYLKDRDEAEEIVQDMFYQLWEKRETTQINSSVKAYLYTAVRNSCLNRIKHMNIKNQHKEYVVRNAEISSDNSMHRVIGKELEEQIAGAINSLPEQCGLIFTLSRQGNLKYIEIADHLEISVKTVENQMGKALKILREKLKNYRVVLIYILISSIH